MVRSVGGGALPGFVSTRVLLAKAFTTGEMHVLPRNAPSTPCGLQMEIHRYDADGVMVGSSGHIRKNWDRV